MINTDNINRYEDLDHNVILRLPEDVAEKLNSIITGVQLEKELEEKEKKILSEKKEEEVSSTREEEKSTKEKEDDFMKYFEIAPLFDKDSRQFK
jgi:hypothetical protein